MSIYIFDADGHLYFRVEKTINNPPKLQRYNKEKCINVVFMVRMRNKNRHRKMRK